MRFKPALLCICHLAFCFLQAQETEKNILLDGIVIKPKKPRENPAAKIIEKALVFRKINLLKTQNFIASVYAKSKAEITQKPDTVKMLGINVSAMIPNLGIAYLSESIAVLHYQHNPKCIKEEMIASKASGIRDLYSLNRIQEGVFNLYDNRIYAETFSKRYFVSPLAEDCFLYYQYDNLEISSQGKDTTYQLDFVGKRKTDAVFGGTIWLHGKDFQIQKVRLRLDASAGLAFIDSLTLWQNYEKLANEVFFPTTQDGKGSFSWLGVKGIFQASTRYHNVELVQTFPSKTFNGETFSVEETALQNNDFWQSQRKDSLKLSEKEKDFYWRYEMAEEYFKSDEYLDNTDRKDNAFSVEHLARNGYHYQITKKQTAFGLKKLRSLLGYNPIEGYVLQANPYLKIWQKDNENLFTLYQANTRLGVFDKSPTFYGNFKIAQNMGKILPSIWWFDVGYSVFAIAQNNGVAEDVSSLYNLLYKENPVPLYAKGFVQQGFFKEWFNGFFTQSQVEYFFQRERLQNRYNNSWLFPKKDFAPNDPTTDKIYSNGLTLHLDLVYRIGQRYERYGNERWVHEQKYPSIHLQYKGALFGDENASRWDYLSARIAHQFDFRTIGVMQLSASYGVFTNALRVNVYDYHSFPSGLNTIFKTQKNDDFFNQYAKNWQDDFLMLPYNFMVLGQHSTWHVRQDLKTFLWNRILWWRNFTPHWHFGYNGLWSSERGVYHEFYFGFYKIFRVLEINVATSLYAGKWQNPQVKLKIALP